MLAGAGRILVRNRVRVIFAAAAVAVSLTAVFAVSHAAASIGGLLKVRLGGDAQQTRLVMDIDQAASARLVSDGLADGHAVLLLPRFRRRVGCRGPAKAW